MKNISKDLGSQGDRQPLVSGMKPPTEHDKTPYQAYKSTPEGDGQRHFEGHKGFGGSNKGPC